MILHMNCIASVNLAATTTTTITAHLVSYSDISPAVHEKAKQGCCSLVILSSTNRVQGSHSTLARIEIMESKVNMAL
jgi:hypothetical protein